MARNRGKSKNSPSTGSAEKSKEQPAPGERRESGESASGPQGMQQPQPGGRKGRKFGHN